uniref:Putative immunoglobulin-binding protein 1 n=1 Tax=Tabanus bromius TaxID=304241 RepID=A0A0K8TNB6_TABBR
MAEGEEAEANRTLRSIFKEGYDLYNELEASTDPTNSREYQGHVQKCIKLFEDSTRLVNIVQMFSSNELMDEIATDHLKYILLPFFLAQLHGKKQSGDRLGNLQIAEVYYKDFLKRCEEYGICKPISTNAVTGISGTQDLVEAAKQRNDKIQEYKMKKELDEHIKLLKVAVEKSHVEEETKREFYIKLIRSSILEAKNELKATQQEIQMQEFMKQRQANMKDGEVEVSRPPPPPLRPIVIHKSVFGRGYPSAPTMTVADFYDERVREGVFPDPEKVNMKALNSIPQENEEEEEAELAQNEELVERDDEEYLARQRAMDEFHDNVRRGEGNRHNRS